MTKRLQRLADHVATQYERRGMDRTRADRIRELVAGDGDVADQAEEQPAGEQPAAADEAGDG